MGFSALIAGILGRGQRRASGDWMELLSSRSGYDRQAAIEMLEDLRHGPALPQLLLRVNDWVPQVQAVAQRAIRTFLSEAFVADWARALESVVALQRARRVDHQELLDAIGTFLGHPSHLPAVLAASTHAPMSVKRYVFELQWRQATDDSRRFEMLRQAFAGPDVVSARGAFARIDLITSPNQRRSFVDAACCSRFAPIRAEGLRLAIDEPVAATPSLVRAMALDDSPTVRAIALGALKAQGDVAAVLASAIARLNQGDLAGRSRATALQFVCSADPLNSHRHCEAAAQSSSAIVRRAAFSALLSATANDGKTELLLRALSDPSLKVQRLAVEHVHRGATVPPEVQVLEIALRHGTAEALSRAFSIWIHSPTWTRLQWLLEALRSALPSGGVQACLRAIEQWEIDASHNFVEPTITQRRTLSAAWKAVALVMPEQQRNRIDFLLRTYRIEE